MPSTIFNNRLFTVYYNKWKKFPRDTGIAIHRNRNLLNSFTDFNSSHMPPTRLWICIWKFDIVIWQ